MRLVINALEQSPNHCYRHAYVSLQKVPKGDNNDIGCFGAPLEGVKSCRNLDVVVSVMR